MQEKTLLRMEELTQLIGIAGDEKAVSQCMRKHMEPYCDEIIYDNLGSMFAVKRCGQKDAMKVMICAHMDEVGFMINGIRKNGLLSFIMIGSMDPQSLHAQRVRVKAANGNEYYGVIVADNEDIKACDVKKMLLDIGASSREEVEDMGIHLGDSAVLDGAFTRLSKHRVLSKAWDDRYGCVLAVELLEELQDIQLNVDVYIGATVMEEVGMRGATTATGMIHPDMGIVLDCSFAADVNGEENAVGQLGKGILLRYYDKGMMPNRALLNDLKEICIKNDIPYQYFYNMGQTDAAWIHKLFHGCPTLSACICGRNVHTGNSMIDLRDYDAAKTAVCKMVQSLDSKKVQSFKEENR